MKKIIALLLCCAFALCSCASSPPKDAESPEAETSAEQSTVAEPEEKQEETPIDFEEVTVIDNEEALVKITGIEPYNVWGYTLNVEIENRSDKELMFSNDMVAVDGIEIVPFWATDVEPGKKSVDSISLLDSTLEENGIKDYSDIELSFSVYDVNDITADSIATGTAHIYPKGEENAVTYQREPKESDVVLLDENGVNATIIGHGPESNGDYKLSLFVKNDTGKNLMLSIDGASINGYMSDPFWANTLNLGHCAFFDVTWMQSTLNESGIESAEDIREIEITITACDKNDMTAEAIAKKTVTLNT